MTMTLRPGKLDNFNLFFKNLSVGGHPKSARLISCRAKYVYFVTGKHVCCVSQSIAYFFTNERQSEQYNKSKSILEAKISYLFSVIYKPVPHNANVIRTSCNYKLLSVMCVHAVSCLSMDLSHTPLRL